MIGAAVIFLRTITFVVMVVMASKDKRKRLELVTALITGVIISTRKILSYHGHYLATRGGHGTHYGGDGGCDLLNTQNFNKQQHNNKITGVILGLGLITGLIIGMMGTMILSALLFFFFLH